MAPPRRVYHRGEQPDFLYSNNNGPNKFNRYFYLRAGKILEVDYERYRIRIEWLQGAGSPKWIPMSFPYIGPSGCFGAVPEKGAIAIFGFFDEGTGKGAPFCLTFLPVGQLVSFDYNTVKVKPDSIANEDQNEIPHRFRKLNEGDVIAMSPLGGEIFLNKNLEFLDDSQDSLLIRSSDQSIIATSLNNFVFADGASVMAGPAMRNSMVLFDSNGNRIPGTNAREITLPDGKESVYIVPFGASIEFDTQFYTEYRIDVDELSNGQLDSNDINDQSADTRDPVVSFVLGNYIGNDFRSPLYGTVIRPILFANRLDTDGSFRLQQCAQNKGMDEISNLGLAYALHFPQNDSFLGVDKEGHYYINLAASIANPLGTGRSMSILAAGNLKEIWGVAADTENSWDLTAKGGIKWVVGNHNMLEHNRSIDIRTSSGSYFEYGGSDDQDFAKQEKTFGNSSNYTGGTRTDEISVDHNIIINGLKTEHIMGSASETIDTDKNVSVAGISSEIVIKEKQCRFGTRKTTISSGDDEYTVVNGYRDETFTLGGKKTEVTSGKIETKVVLGSHKNSVTTGNYEVQVTAGNINHKSTAGNFNAQGLEANIKGLTKATVKGASVQLGFGPTGGVVTGTSGVPSHFDYVTGSPLKGCATVKAGL